MFKKTFAALLCISASILAAEPNRSPNYKTIPLPRFIIGVWQQPAKTMQTWADRGVNTIFTDKPKPENAKRDEYFRAAAAAGLAMVIYPDPTGAEKDLSQPGFLAWQLPDEPENWPKLIKKPDGNFDLPATTAAYADKYNKLKAISPSTPVYGNFNGMAVTSTRDKRGARGEIIKDDYRVFATHTDWLSGDWYVTVMGRDPAKIGQLTGGMLDFLADWSDHKRPLMAFIECCDQKLKMAPKGRAPTPEEMKATIWVSIIHGAQGIIYFPLRPEAGFSWDATPPELVETMKEVHAEILKHEAFFMKGKRTKGAGETATWKLPDGSMLTVAATHNPTSGWSTKVTHKPSSTPASASRRPTGVK